MTIRSVRMLQAGGPVRARQPALLAIQTDPTIVPAPLATVVAAPYAPAGGLMIGTSDTSAVMNSGVATYTFAMNEYGIGFIAGTRVHIASQGTPADWMEGITQGYAEPLLTVTVDLYSSPAVITHNDWSIGVTGQKGLKGDTGPVGPQGPIGQVPEAPNDTHYYVRHAVAWSIFENSPVFTGTPTVPTAPLNDNSQQIANTNHCRLNFQPLDADLTSLAAASAIGVMYYRSAAGVWGPVTVAAGLSFSGGTLGVAGAGFAPLASPVFTGDPTAPTPATADNDNSVATTAYVKANLVSYATLASPIFTGNPTGPNPPPADNTTSLATTGWVTARLGTYAPLASPVFTGNPQGPTVASPGDSSASLATTAFVHNVVGPTVAGLAPLASPVFTGTPRSTTAPPLNDYTNSIPTTKWVTDNVAALGGGIPDAPADSFNYGRKNSTWNNLDALFAPRVSPGFTGNPTAPTPPPGDSSTSIATTAFAQQAGFPSGTVMLFYQATAPVGWTKSTTDNDKALRVVNGSTGGTSGGTNSFSSVMAQTAVGNHTLAAGEIPTITTSVVVYPNGNSGYYVPLNPNSGWATVLAPNTGAYHVCYPANNTTGVTYTNALSGANSSGNTGGGAHNHPLTMAMQYVDVILASKN